MSELHGERRCSPWIHDLLDLIEEHMLLVPSPEIQRKSSKYLLGKLQEMDLKTSDERYCLARKPQNRLSSWTKPRGVLSELNDIARKHVMEVKPKLDTVNADNMILHRSLRRDEWVE